jgi:hypothetical protein
MVSRTVLLSLLLMSLTIPLARAQDPGVLDKTTFGKSNNDERDLANSLVPGPQRYGKGEKKAQIDSAELKSKSIKDSTFGGSLLNMGIDQNEPKLDESKLRTAAIETQSRQQPAATEKEPTVVKQSAAVEKASNSSTQPTQFEPVFSSLSTTATLAANLGESGTGGPANKGSNTSSNSSAGDAHKKDQNAGTTDEKPSTTSTSEKSSTVKPDGDH